MSKSIYCAQCGQELLFALKALPKQALVITIVEPHTCLKETKKNPYKDNNEELVLKPIEETKRKNLDKLFDDFKFSKSLGGKDTIPTTTIFDGASNSGDKRSKDLLYNINDFDNEDSEIKSLAPQGILNSIKNLGPSAPDHELKE